LNTERHRIACALGAFVFGFGLWASAPWLVGTREPWDAQAPFYYTGAMLLGGAALGGALPRHCAAATLGLWAGQAISMLLLPGHDRTWAALGVVTTGVGSLIGLAAPRRPLLSPRGAASASRSPRRRTRRRRRRSGR
jgi:hypothetical protein